jgi:6-phosphogluconolactonase/glucosamine-6-phosphate isomerase/deaminase
MDKIKNIQKETALYLSKLLENTKRKNKKVLLLLSGGSNLDYLNHISTENIDSRVTISTLDERCTTDPTKNNMAQIKNTTFYGRSKKNGCNFIDTTIQNGESRTQMVARINQKLLDWFEKNPEGEVIITAGIGADGHIAGMKPLPKEKFNDLFANGNPDQLVVGYDASNVDPENPKRNTTTMNFFRKVKNYAKVILYAINKDEALQKIAAREGLLNETPARVLKEMKNVTIFSNTL